MKFGENSLTKEFDSEPVYNKNYLTPKIKSYNGKINTNFHDNKIPKEGSQYICLSVILIESVFIIHSFFMKNINILLKKIRFLGILLTI